MLRSKPIRSLTTLTELYGRKPSPSISFILFTSRRYKSRSSASKSSKILRNVKEVTRQPNAKVDTSQNKPSSLKKPEVVSQALSKSSVLTSSVKVLQNDNDLVSAPRQEAMDDPELLLEGIKSLTIQNIQVGDYVEYMIANGSLIKGIVSRIKVTTSSGNNIFDVYGMANKEFLNMKTSGVVWTIPNFSSSDIFKTYMNDDVSFDLENKESQKIAHRAMKDLSEAAKKLLHSKLIIFNKARQIVEEIAWEDPSFLYPMVTVEALAKRIFETQNPSTAELLATFTHLINDSRNFIPTPHVRQTGIFMLCSQQEANDIEYVVNSIRQNQEEFKAFLDKAKKLIEFKRSHGHPLFGHFSAEDLKTASTTLPSFTDSDKCFIRFIMDSLLRPRGSNISTFDTFVPSIIKPLKMYEDLMLIDRELRMQFLIDIGVFAPWESAETLRDPNLKEHTSSQKAETNQRRMTEREKELLASPQFEYPNNGSKPVFQSPIKTSQEFLSTEFYKRDLCEDIRHDFGDLPVYTIDDPSAAEIDDGISLERVPGGGSWVHVHIADPTTYLPPFHELSLIAQRRASTAYLISQQFSMLPKSISSERMSILNVDKKKGMPVMTFSTQIDEDGEIREHCVRPGIIRKSATLYYDDVDKGLNWDSVEPSPVSVYVHPGPLSDSRTSKVSKISDGVWADLKELQAITQKHYFNRVRNGGIFYNHYNAQVSVDPFPLPASDFSLDRPIYRTVLPTIYMQTDISSFSPARLLVAEAMIMAGRACSRWCRERGVPVINRYQSSPKIESAKDRTLYESVVQTRNPKTGAFLNENIAKITPLFQGAFVGVDAGLQHWSMGILDGYTKVTSPLRRYADLVSHWQIKAALLGLGLPFPKDKLMILAPGFAAREKIIQGIGALNTRFWIMQYFQRCMNEGKEMFLTALVTDVDVSDSGEIRTVANTKELGARGLLKTKRKLEVGEVVKAKVIMSNPSELRLHLEVVE